MYWTGFFFVWFQVGIQEAVDIARPFTVGVDKPEPLFACKKLVEVAVSRGSLDDISVMLIQLGHYIWSSLCFKEGWLIPT